MNSVKVTFDATPATNFGRKRATDNQCPLRVFVVVIIREIVRSAHMSVSEKCAREEREDRRKIFRYITLDTCTV